MMERLHFTKLQFPLVKIKPKTDLTDKLEFLNQVPTLDRILGTIAIFDSNNKIIFKPKGILDTGAVISLLPGSVLTKLDKRKTVPHTMWGIVEKQECKITVDLAEIPIKLIDQNGLTSPDVKTIVGFSRQNETPVLIGMKNLLAQYSFHFNSNKNIFEIWF